MSANATGVQNCSCRKWRGRSSWASKMRLRDVDADRVRGMIVRAFPVPVCVMRALLLIYPLSSFWKGGGDQTSSWLLRAVLCDGPTTVLGTPPKRK